MEVSIVMLAMSSRRTLPTVLTSPCRLRCAAAAATGGQIKPPEAEWRFRGQVIVDGLDPEGNVLQFRQVDRN